MFKLIVLLSVLGICLGQFSTFHTAHLQPRPPLGFSRPIRPTTNLIRHTNTPVRIVRPFVRLLRSNAGGPYADGSYFFNFASEDGIEREESGRQKPVDTNEITGAYSYTSPEGIFVSARYIADEHGFRVESPNLPVGPAPPPHAVAQIRAAQEAFARRGLVYRSGHQI